MENLIVMKVSHNVKEHAMFFMIFYTLTFRDVFRSYYCQPDSEKQHSLKVSRPLTVRNWNILPCHFLVALYKQKYVVNVALIHASTD